MKRLSVCVVFGLWAATVVAAEESSTQKADLASLQGEWSMTTGALDGADLPEAMARQFKRVCQADEVTVTNGSQVVMKAKITLDPTKTPKTIDYEVLDGPTKGKKHLGIYELDGDTFKSCFAAPDTERPTEFSTKTGDRRAYSIWKREAK
jgi:uncharacterized protein (TIGR03067 family)